MGTLHRGYFLGASQWHNIDIGCLANFRTFDYLPLMLLPRLKMALFAFWTSGCVFDGPQRALVDTWFVMYPAVVEVVVLYFSLLNLLAKLFRLRDSDAMFGPTVVFFCALCWLRDSLTDSDWLEFDGRVTSVVSMSEFNAVTLVDFLTPSMALRTNGNIKSIFYSKVLVFAASLLPFVWSLLRAKRTFTSDPMSRIEKALAVRFRNAGGLGHLDSYNLGSSAVLNSYEVVRFGYAVFGDSTSSDSYLIAFDDWDLVAMQPDAFVELLRPSVQSPRETWRCNPRRSARDGAS